MQGHLQGRRGEILNRPGRQVELLLRLTGTAEGGTNNLSIQAALQHPFRYARTPHAFILVLLTTIVSLYQLCTQFDKACLLCNSRLAYFGREGCTAASH